MNKVGVTKETKPCVDGVFYLVDTMGLPLGVVIGILESEGVQIAWDRFIDDAFKAGWKKETIKKRICEAVLDHYGREYFDKWFIILEKYLSL